MIRAVCSEKGGLKILMVFVDSGHILQVSLYYNPLKTTSLKKRGRETKVMKIIIKSPGTFLGGGGCGGEAFTGLAVVILP